MFYNRIYYTSRNIYRRVKNPFYRNINTMFDESNYNSPGNGGNNNNSNNSNIMSVIISLVVVYNINNRDRN